mgnify:CR=1 FL=1
MDELQFASPFAVILNGELFLTSSDPRSHLTLTALGQEFVKSLIWHTARVGNMRDAKVALLRTPSAGAGKRLVRFDVLEGPPRYSLDQIDDMILETYRIWELIQMERRASSQDTAAKAGGLF